MKHEPVTQTFDIYVVVRRTRRCVHNERTRAKALKWIADYGDQHAGQIWLHHRSAATSLLPDWKTKAHLERLR